MPRPWRGTRIWRKRWGQLHAAVRDLAETRWSARGPAVLAAAARAIAREQARLDAALLGLVGDVDGRDDVVPRAETEDRGRGVPAHRARAWTGTAPAGTPPPPA